MAVLDTLFLIFINLIWGFNFIALTWAVDDFPPLVANAIRFLIVAILLAPFLRHTVGRLREVLGVAFLLGVMHFGVVIMAMKLSDGVTSVAIVSQLSIPFATIFAILMLKEHVGWKRITGIAFSFAGVLIIGFDPVIFSQGTALVMMALGAAFIALSTIYMRRLKDVAAMTIQGWVGVMAVIGSALLSMFFEKGQMEAIENASYIAWASITFSAIFASVLGHGGVNYLLRKYEVSVVTPYMLLMPVFAVIGGVIILNEALTSRVILGALITFVGVIIITLRNNVRQRDPLVPGEEV